MEQIKKTAAGEPLSRDDRETELSELAANLQTIAESEKVLLARQLHDELGGALVVPRWTLHGCDGVSPAPILKSSRAGSAWSGRSKPDLPSSVGWWSSCGPHYSTTLLLRGGAMAGGRNLRSGWT